MSGFAVTTCQLLILFAVKILHGASIFSADIVVVIGSMEWLKCEWFLVSTLSAILPPFVVINNPPPYTQTLTLSLVETALLEASWTSTGKYFGVTVSAYDHVFRNPPNPLITT
jgi:hypothetical protein